MSLRIIFISIQIHDQKKSIAYNHVKVIINAQCSILCKQSREKSKTF